MNIRSNPDTTLPAVTTGPLPASRKIFVTPDEAPDVRVPLREIILSEGAGEPNLPVYDTSGPYTDPTVTIDVNVGGFAAPAYGAFAGAVPRLGVEILVGIGQKVNAAQKIGEMDIVGGGKIPRGLPKVIVMAAIESEHDKLRRGGRLVFGVQRRGEEQAQ